MRRTMLGVALGSVMALCAEGCATSVDEDAEPIPEPLDEALTPRGKPVASSPAPSMICTQGTGGCVPTGYRSTSCAIANLKPNTDVVTCVKARCPSVYGMTNAKGETCFPSQRVALDGTAQAFFAVLPDTTYQVTTYAAPKSGLPSTVIASTTATVAASVGVSTQCGGDPTSTCF